MKNYKMGEVKTTSSWIETSKTLIVETITNNYTLYGVELKLIMVIRMKPGVTCTSKCS